MKKKTSIKFLYTKITNTNIAGLILNLYKIKSNINLISKFILLLAILTNTNEFTSIWDFSDLTLKIIEQEIKNVKVDDVSVADTSIIEESKEVKKEVEEIDFDKMELGEWFDYLREHEPKAYWFWVFAFVGTSIFCVWLMHYLIGPGIPPRDPN